MFSSLQKATKVQKQIRDQTVIVVLMAGKGLKTFLIIVSLCTQLEEEGGQGVQTPTEKSQNRGFLSNTGLDPRKFLFELSVLDCTQQIEGSYYGRQILLKVLKVLV